jgi:hypothetical protein
MRTGLLLLAVLLFGPAYAQSASRIRDRLAPTVCGRCIATESVRPCEQGRPEVDDGQLQLYLRRATGSLTVPVVIHTKYTSMCRYHFTNKRRCCLR